ncbi:MAG: prepilin-type N-terminal cleavage/methylation domain-containing protein [Verrucomicrobia bacterium]|nr:prepilin-type N-terminal cleavage/methylation domain-containing protein [Verrucomicrobiota bacterium]
MECKTTSSSRRRGAAFTLIEMIVASAIGAIVMVALAQLTMFSSRSIAVVFNYVDLDQYSRKALDRMVTDWRQADKLVTITNNNTKLIFNTQGGTNNLTYEYSTNTLKLTRTYGTETTTLLTNCTSLAFTIFTSTTIPGTFDQFYTTNAANAKLIKVDWTCTRRLWGTDNVNSESIQSAKIVIRKS